MSIAGTGSVAIEKSPSLATVNLRVDTSETYIVFGRVTMCVNSWKWNRVPKDSQASSTNEAGRKAFGVDAEMLGAVTSHIHTLSIR